MIVTTNLFSPYFFEIYSNKIEKLRNSNFTRPHCGNKNIGILKVEDREYVIVKSTVGYLGKGGQSVVTKAFDLQNQRVVVQVRSKGTTNEYRLEREVKVLDALNAKKVPFVLQKLDVYFYEHIRRCQMDEGLNVTYYKRRMIVEYCEGGDLFQQPPITIEQAKLWANELLVGMREVHKLGILHRDLKAENIFIKNGHLVIGDWGHACFITDSMSMRERGGTQWFLPPEILSKPYITKENDYWGVGLILYFLFNDRKFPPHIRKSNPPNTASFFDKFHEFYKSYALDAEPGTPAFAIRSLLNPDPALRASFDAVTISK